MPLPLWKDIEEDLRASGATEEGIKNAKRVYYDDLTKDPEFASLPETDRAQFKLDFLGSDEPSLLSKIGTFGKQFLGSAQEATQGALDTALRIATLGANALPSNYTSGLERAPELVRKAGDYLREKSPIGVTETLPGPNPDEVLDLPLSPVPIPKTIGAAGNIAANLAAGAVPWVAAGSLGLVGRGAGLLTEMAGFGGAEGAAELTRGKSLEEAAQTAGQTALGVGLLGGAGKLFSKVYAKLRADGKPEAEAVRAATEASRAAKEDPTSSLDDIIKRVTEKDVTAEPDLSKLDGVIAKVEEVPTQRKTPTMLSDEELAAALKELPSERAVDPTIEQKYQDLLTFREAGLLPGEARSKVFSGEAPEPFIIDQMKKDVSAPPKQEFRWPVDTETPLTPTQTEAYKSFVTKGFSREAAWDMAKRGETTSSVVTDEAVMLMKDDVANLKNTTSPAEPPKLPESAIVKSTPKTEEVKPVEVKAPGVPVEPPKQEIAPVEPDIDYNAFWKGRSLQERRSLMFGTGHKRAMLLDSKSPVIGDFNEAVATAEANTPGGGQKLKDLTKKMFLEQQGKPTPPKTPRGRKGEKGAISLEPLVAAAESAEKSTINKAWIESFPTQIEKLGPEGKAVTGNARSFLSFKNALAHTWHESAKKALGVGRFRRGLKPASRENVTRELDGNNTNDVAAKSVAQKLKAIFDDIYRVAEKQGVEGLKKRVKEYVPHFMNEDALRAIRQGGAESQVYKNIIEDTMRERNFTREEAVEALEAGRSFYDAMRRRQPGEPIPGYAFGSLQKARKVFLREEYREMDIIKIMDKYIDSSSHLISWERYGKKEIIPNLERLLDKSDPGWRNGVELSEKGKLISDYLLSLHGRPTSRTAETAFMTEHPSVKRLLDNLTGFAIEGGAVEKNIVQPLDYPTAGKISDLFSALRDPKELSRGAESGVARTGISEEFGSDSRFSRIRKDLAVFPVTEVGVRSTTRAASKKSFEDLREKMDSDVMAYEQAKDYARDEAKLLAEELARRVGKEDLDWIGSEMMRPDMPEEAWLWVQNKATHTALRAHPSEVPPAWSGEFAKIALRLMRFAYSKPKYVKEAVWDQAVKKGFEYAAKGDTNTAGKMFAMGLTRLGKSYASVVAGGLASNLVWSWFNNRFDQSLFEKAHRIMKEDKETGKKFTEMLRVSFEAALYNGWLGLVTDQVANMARAAKTGQYDFNPGGFFANRVTDIISAGIRGGKAIDKMIRENPRAGFRDLSKSVEGIATRVAPAINRVEKFIPTGSDLGLKAEIDAKTIIARNERDFKAAIESGDSGLVDQLWPKHVRALRLSLEQAVADKDFEAALAARRKLLNAQEMYKTYKKRGIAAERGMTPQQKKAAGIR